MGAGMALAFVFFPISLILALASAIVTRARWEAWSPVERVVGMAPLSLLLLAVLVVVLAAIFGR